MLVEIGGTVGDIESLPFLEAIRQFRQDVGRDNTLYVHLTLVPFIGTAGELKTKPTQHSVRDLRSIGIQPDILLCRTDRFLDPDIKRKIALFCDVDEEAVITAKDVVDDLRSAARARRRRPRPHRPQVPAPAADRAAHAGVGRRWSTASSNPVDELTIHVVGKYVGYEDSYKSLNEALYHGGFPHRLKVNIKWIEAEALEAAGRRGAARRRRRHPRAGRLRRPRHARMMKAAQIARERGIPVLRHLLRLPVGDGRVRAQRRRACATPTRPSARRTRRPRSSTSCAICSASTTSAARCGSARTPASSRPARWRSASTARRLIHERHRHRYEFNCLYERTLDRARPADLGPLARRQVRRDRRAARPSVVSSPCSSIRSSSRSRRSRIRCLPASSTRRYRHKTGHSAPNAETQRRRVA